MTATNQSNVSFGLELPGQTFRRSRRITRLIRRQPVGAVCAVALFAVIAVAVLADVLAPYAPNENDVGPVLESPNRDYPFGTDQFGRDILSRVIYGSRTSLMVGLGATLIGAAGAGILGMISGYRGGVFDYVLQRFVDAAQALPPLVLLMAIITMLGPSVTNVILALSFRGALTLSRVVRGAVIGIRNASFIEAAQSTGVPAWRLLGYYIFPNVVPTIVILISTSIGANIVAEASLSFLGLGVPPPDATWGGMMSADGRQYMLVNPWILVFPTVALGVVVFAMNMLGDSLRDEIDPRLRGA